MRKKIRELICALIPNKGAKAKVRHYIGAIRPWLDIKNFISFVSSKVLSDTVLIAEPNECHGECLCSYIKYFKDSGKRVHLITTPSVMKLEPLYNLPENYLPEKVFQLSPQQFRNFFKFKKLSKYDFIFLCSTKNFYYEQSNIKALKIPQEIQPKLLLMEHDLRQIEPYDENEFLDNKRLFVITNFTKNPKINSLSPHYFHYAKSTPKTDAVTNFITVGALDIKRRNITILYDAISKLYQEGIKNFKITVIGGGKVEDIPQNIAEFFDLKSRLSFPEMADELNNADFILPLLDPNNKDNRNYLQFLTTGTKQLVLGFQKPCIINSEFAAALDFDGDNSLIYSDNEIFEQMKRAIFMDNAEYDALKSNLNERANSLYESSLKTLKEVLNG